MSDSFIAEIRILPYTFAPKNWADCDGQLISISQNTALFSLLGVTYGGNGQITFGIPKLNDRVALGWQQGPGLSYYSLGQQSGTSNVTLNSSQMPAHNHTVGAYNRVAETSNPSNAVAARVRSENLYVNATPNTQLATTIGISGGVAAA